MNEKIAEWNDFRLFLAVAREGGLSPAAKATHRSAATIGRRMLALERATGRELFVRHDRGYELTSEGRQLFEELAEIETRFQQLSVKMRAGEMPLVKVSAGTWTTLALMREAEKITGVPADLRIRFISAENILDISRREVVIGFRNSRPTQEGLAGRQLVRVEFAPYSRPGAPDRWIKTLVDTPSGRWLEKTVGHDAIFEVSAPRNSLDLALAGSGIALLPTFIGDACDQLLRIGPPVSELSHNQWIVSHQDDRHLPEVRRAIDRMSRLLGARRH